MKKILNMPPFKLENTKHIAVNKKLAKGSIMDAILAQYEKVFDNEGNVKVCTREECIKLIELLEARFPDEDFGNDKTGFVNTERIVELIKKL